MLFWIFVSIPFIGLGALAAWECLSRGDSETIS